MAPLPSMADKSNYTEDVSEDTLVNLQSSYHDGESEDYQLDDSEDIKLQGRSLPGGDAYDQDQEQSKVVTGYVDLTDNRTNGLLGAWNDDDSPTTDDSPTVDDSPTEEPVTEDDSPTVDDSPTEDDSPTDDLAPIQNLEPDPEPAPEPEPEQPDDQPNEPAPEAPEENPYEPNNPPDQQPEEEVPGPNEGPGADYQQPPDEEPEQGGGEDYGNSYYNEVPEEPDPNGGEAEPQSYVRDENESVDKEAPPDGEWPKMCQDHKAWCLMMINNLLEGYEAREQLLAEEKGQGSRGMKVGRGKQKKCDEKKDKKHCNEQAVKRAKQQKMALAKKLLKRTGMAKPTMDDKTIALTVIAAIIWLALIGFLIWFCCFRRGSGTSSGKGGLRSSKKSRGGGGGAGKSSKSTKGKSIKDSSKKSSKGQGGGVLAGAGGPKSKLSKKSKKSLKSSKKSAKKTPKNLSKKSNKTGKSKFIAKKSNAVYIKLPASIHKK